MKKMGMKKKGRGMNEAKKSKKCVKFLIVLLFVIGTTIAPAAAWNGDNKSIKSIDEKLELIDEDPIINSFLYNRMSEYNEEGGIEAVKIVVIKGSWWSEKKEVKTFYVVRNDTGEQIDIVDEDDYAGDDTELWTFYPNIGRTIKALDMIISCFEDRMTYKKAVRCLVGLGILTVTVDKDNVPSITEIINNSPWASSYLPDWAKNFLERLEGKH
ncbi:MAG: hypothetical protein KAT65_13890 [Methanophagales archaeon]|nr:hypothetical protein [Methanophagales archaeon]